MTQDSRESFLFAYGTLRVGFVLEWKKTIADDLIYVGPGTVNARLYDIGAYPGAVQDHTGPELFGDVFMIKNPESMLRILDEYEGFSAERPAACEYIRGKNRVKLETGSAVDAWIYWYNRDTQGKTRIEPQDYLHYIKHRGDAINQTTA